MYLLFGCNRFAGSRCASCFGESARAHWFRHSDGWRSGSSTFGSGSGQGLMTSQSSGHRRSPWDSLPSLRQDSSLNDSGYKSTRADSLEQRYSFLFEDQHLSSIPLIILTNGLFNLSVVCLIDKTA